MASGGGAVVVGRHCGHRWTAGGPFGCSRCAWSSEGVPLGPQVLWRGRTKTGRSGTAFGAEGVGEGLCRAAAVTASSRGL